MTAQLTGAAADRADAARGAAPGTFVLSDAGHVASTADPPGDEAPATLGSDRHPPLGAAPGASVLDRAP